MYYKELYFQNHKVRFINTNIVVKDVYDFFGKYYPKNISSPHTINTEDVTNLKECNYNQNTFETYSFYQVSKVLDLFKEEGKAVEIFRNWLSNFAYVYIEDFIVNNIEQNKLQKTLDKLEAENTELKAAISKCTLDTSSLNFSLDILSQVLGLDVNIQTGEKSSIKLNNLEKDVHEIISILSEQVGLEYKKPIEESLKDKLDIAFESLKPYYGIYNVDIFNLHFLQSNGYNLKYRAKNRGLTMIEYIAKNPCIAKLVLDYIPKLIKQNSK
jgi:hypothetical protein